MINFSSHTVNRGIAQLIVAASLFCMLFGQGIHLHEIALHLDSHLDVHIHVHAHESQDDARPLQTDAGQNEHKHEVNRASDIVGLRTTSPQHGTLVFAHAVLSLSAGGDLVSQENGDFLSLFNLPPPKSLVQFHLSSFSHRGPPLS